MRICTCGATEKRLASPLAAARNFQKKKKFKRSPSAAASKVQKREDWKVRRPERQRLEKWRPEK